MTDRAWTYALAGLLSPIFWLVTLSVALWITRLIAPRWERLLFVPFSEDPALVDLKLKIAAIVIGMVAAGAFLLDWLRQ